MLDYLDELSDFTGELCFIAQRNGPNLQYVIFRHFGEVDGAIPKAGLERPLAHAASGKVLLSFLREDEIVGIVNRNNQFDREFRISPNSLLPELDAVRSTGIASSSPQFTPGLIGYATWLGASSQETPCAIGVAVSTVRDGAKRERVISALNDLHDRNTSDFGAYSVHAM
ncbi:MAG: hypothetical protein J0J06_13725 [Sphingomonas sp.]|uniref:IclR family transcriptional regulator domain-containing protein n=1 Tax=Sphingomonas sp. TaxID=28214 RepID=UPI001ACD6945|nr:IclR family transcriptional regulator C-terminal domain-containing protein [Sphingomonas sp.]MBN8816493.1 hypothetical protein [Sphingomonas sp.]